MTAVGLFMLACGTMKSEFIVYRLLVARSRLLWGDGDAVHRFYQFSGLVVAILGTLWAMGYGLWAMGDGSHLAFLSRFLLLVVEPPQHLSHPRPADAKVSSQFSPRLNHTGVQQRLVIQGQSHPI